MLGGDGRRHELSEVLAEEFAAIAEEPTALDAYGIEAPLADALETAEDLALMLERRSSQQAAAVERSRRRLLYQTAHCLKWSALCLSGGGIRSATLSLGVIQGLVDTGLLKQFNYMSTVSGGGYTGSWLSSWLHHSGNADAVLSRLGSPRNNPDRETAPLAHLRAYSNFLTPRVGLFTADTWAAVAMVLRNILINWLILVPALALLVIGMKLVALALTTGSENACLQIGVAVACLLAGGMALGYKLGHLYAPPDIDPMDDRNPVGGRDPVGRANTAQRRFLCWSLAPAMIGGLCFVWLARQQLAPADVLLRLFDSSDGTLALSMRTLERMLLFAAVVYGIALVVGFFWATPSWRAAVLGAGRLFAIGGWDLLAWLGAVAVFATLLWLGVHWVGTLQGSVTLISQLACITSTNACVLDARPHPVPLSVEAETLVVIFGLPWFLLSTLLAHTVYLLLRSRSFEGDVEREWLGRASGWHFIAGLAWIMVATVVLIGPWVFYNLTLTVNVLTAISGAVTALLGKSGLTSAKAGASSSWTGFGANVALAVAGPLFAVLLLTLLSVGVDAWLAGSGQQCFPPDGTWTPCDKNPCLTWRWWEPLIVAVVVLVAANCFANINAFSLHAIYRNRLVRAFLGGARSPHRGPDAFTAFDWSDDLRVASLWDSTTRPIGPNWRPFHVINMTLNLTETNRLAWQQRKAMPFSVSPFFCGNADLGYRATDWYGDEPRAAVGGAPPPMSGISLGTAMAISGAAISSNMGYLSSMSLSFLLTFFNVRLGVWLGNPGWRGRGTPYRRAGPSFAALSLLAELFGLTTADRRYVNLSDGGHFEDFGLYEMVRRRCKWIVLVDGGQDAERGFVDLGNAVRKIWIDLGARIEFHQSPLLAAEKDAKAAGVPYFAVGTIRYLSDADVCRPRDPCACGSKTCDSCKQANSKDIDCGPPPSPVGHILYLKPVVRGDEMAADVIAYKRAHEAFPDQSTAEQWYDESQFEAYRRLGQLMVERVVAAACEELHHRPQNLQELFKGLENVDPSKVPPSRSAPAAPDPTAQDDT